METKGNRSSRIKTGFQKMLGVILCISIMLTTFVCSVGLPAGAASGGNMFEFKSAAGYPFVEYLSAEEFVKGDSYTFTCKFLSSNSQLFTYSVAQLKDVFTFWGADSSGGGTRLVWSNMPGFSIAYDTETKTVTAHFTAGDDPVNNRTMTPGTNDYIQFRFGDRNAAYRGWGNFWFADFSLIHDSTGTEILTAPIDSSNVTTGAAASNKNKWSTAEAGSYCTVKAKGTTFGDPLQPQENTNLFYINGNQTNLQVQFRTTGDYFKYVAGEQYIFTCKVKCNVPGYIARGKLLHFSYYNNDSAIASISKTTDENYSESYDSATYVYTATFTVPDDCRDYNNTHFAFGDRGDQLSGYQAYFTDFAIKRVSTGVTTEFPLVTSDNVYNTALAANDKYRIPSGQTSKVLVQEVGTTFDPGYVKQTYENVMQLRGGAGQSIYQILPASDFQYGNSYEFSVDIITRKTGSTPDMRVRAYSAIGAGGAYREETLSRTEDSNTYTCTFAYQFSGSGDAFKVFIGTYDDEDNIVVGNPELYLLDSSGYKTGDNLILDPGFTTGVSNADHSTAEHPWFSSGTADVSIFAQPVNYFAYDPLADYDTDTPKMLLLRHKAWMFLYEEVAAVKFETGAQYRFSVDIIHINKGPSGGTKVAASTLDSGDNWASQPLSRIEGTNRYSCTYTHQSTKTKGTAFQVMIYTQDVDDYCIIGNPELYKLNSSGDTEGDNLISDPGFHTGINPANSWSEEAYPWFSSNYGNVSNTEYCSFVKQPENYFNIATEAEPNPEGTAPQKNMLRVESNGWEGLVFEPYLTPGKTYRFTYNRKYFGDQGSPGILVLRYRNSGGLTKLPDGSTSTANNGYTTTVTINVPDDAKTTSSNFKFRFYFGEAAGNTVYLGNLDLRELDGSGDPIGENLVPNSGFYGKPGAVDTSGTDERASVTPAMWSYAVSGTYGKADIVKMPENFFGETVSAQKRAIKVTGSNWSCIRSSVHLNAGNSYQLSYNYKYDTHAPRISMQQVSSSGDFSALAFDTLESQSEFKKTHTFTMGSDVASGENCILRFWLAENAVQSEAYWYNIELYELDAGGSVTGKNLLDNGDFAVGDQGTVKSLFGWKIEGAPFDGIELSEVPADYFTYYSPAECLMYMIGNLLDTNPASVYLSLDRNKDGAVSIIDLVALKKYFAIADDDSGTDIPTDWYSDGNIKITLAQVNQVLSAEYVKPKNVILMIGDGMGPNDIRLAEENSPSKYEFGLILNKITNTGFATTYSASSNTTDSAAGGTALATGYKTNNGYVGVSPTGETLKNLSEYARDAGKKVGIVTNDSGTGATPACFGAHVDSRGSSSDIAQQIATFAPDVFIGQDYADFSGLDLSGFVLAEDFAQFRDVLNTYNRQGDRKFMGFINYNATYSSEINILSHCTEVALNCLSKNSPEGFFLMVENTTTDNAGHANYINGKLNGVVALDRAVAAVFKFMKDNPDTLLVITSDHETGGVTIPSGSYTLDSSLFTTTKHTNADVRTFAVGYGAEYFNGKTVDNTDVGNFLISAITG